MAVAATSAIASPLRSSLLPGSKLKQQLGTPASHLSTYHAGVHRQLVVVSAAGAAKKSWIPLTPRSRGYLLLEVGGTSSTQNGSMAPSQAIFAHLDSLSLILLRAPLAKRNSSRRSQGISWAVAHEEAARVEEREGEEEKEEVAPSAPNTKLYFGNLPYSCDSSQLAAIIQEYGSPELVEVLYDRNTGKSRGFAFVTMSSFQDANAVIENLDGSEYGGRILRVNFSDKPKPREPLYPETEFKLFVGNLSWSVNSESLMDMFSGYGNVVGARVLYDGETGRSRGYGFVCFSSKSEMEAALESLNGVELEGRRMRISLALGKRS